MLLQGDEKNLNKKNFCLAAFKINLVYTAALIALCIALFFAGSYVGKSKAASNKVSAGQETDVSDSQTENEYTQTSSQMITKNNMSDDTDMSKDYTYNSDKKTFSFTIDGVSMTYPVTAGQLKSTGYTYMSQASQPHSQALMTSYANSKSGTKVALTITLSDTSQDDIKCSEMQVNFSDNTEFLGLNKKSDVSKVKSVFSSADKEDITDFNEKKKEEAETCISNNNSINCSSYITFCCTGFIRQMERFYILCIIYCNFRNWCIFRVKTAR